VRGRHLADVASFLFLPAAFAIGIYLRCRACAAIFRQPAMARTSTFSRAPAGNCRVSCGRRVCGIDWDQRVMDRACRHAKRKTGHGMAAKTTKITRASALWTLFTGGLPSLPLCRACAARKNAALSPPRAACAPLFHLRLIAGCTLRRLALLRDAHLFTRRHALPLFLFLAHALFLPPSAALIPVPCAPSLRAAITRCAAPAHNTLFSRGFCLPAHSFSRRDNGHGQSRVLNNGACSASAT